MFIEQSNRISAYKSKLCELLSAPRLKYSKWPPVDTSAIRGSVGVYHFYELDDDGGFVSAYVGKAGFGNKGTWDLYSRLKQHFQPSQKNTLLGNASDVLNITSAQAKLQFTSGSMYLQWLTLTADPTDMGANLEDDLRSFECFAISILRPKYTVA